MDLDENFKILSNIKTTMAVEGNYLNQNDEELINKYLNNEITEQEGVDIIKKDIMSKINNKNV